MPLKLNTSKVVFRLLAVYVLFQFFWWAFHIVQLHRVIRNLELSYRTDLPHEVVIDSYHNKVLMVIGEGVVFVILLLFGLWRIGVYLNREAKLARQERNFMLAVTHELKTPVATLRLFLDTMRSRKLTESQTSQMLGDAVNETHRLDHLVENILLSTRFEQGGSTHHEALNLSDLIRSISGKLKQSIGGNHDLELNVEDGLEVKGDPIQLESLIANLYDNAVKYAPEGTVIFIEAVKQGDRAMLAVADLGPGIPAEERPMVMKKFYRIGSEETRKTKGTGLGLYLAGQIVKQHKAEIRIEDNAPRGTRFLVFFPLEKE